MQNVKIKGRKHPIKWPLETMQQRRSVYLTPEEREKLINYMRKHGCVKTLENSGLGSMASIYNIRNNGFGRESSINKIRAMLNQ